MRKLILAAALVALIPGSHGAALAQGTITVPAKPSLAGDTQTDRAQMLAMLEVGGFALMLDRAWDFMAVAPYNDLNRLLAQAQVQGLPRFGISASEADAAIQRGMRAGDTFAKSSSKTSVEGRQMIGRLKNIFEK